MTWWERMLEPEVLGGLALLITAIGGMQIWQLVGQHVDRRARRRREQQDAEIRSDVATVKEQVQNSHIGRNLRDDVDRLQSTADAQAAAQRQQAEALQRIERALDGHGLSIGGIRDDVRLIRRDMTGDREAVATLRADAVEEHDRLRDEIRQAIATDQPPPALTR